MNTFNIDLIKIKTSIFFLIITIFTTGITFFVRYFYYTDSIFYNTYAEQLSYERVQEVIGMQTKYQWFAYLFIPLILIIKILYNTCCITSGSLLKNDRGEFKDNYNICLKAEYVFVLMLIVKFSCLVIYKRVNTLYDLAFIPGSLASLSPTSSTPQWYQYPLQTVSIWEVLYCFVGTSMYAIQHNVSKSKAAVMFCIPYLIGLLIWIIVVVFITLQFS